MPEIPEGPESTVVDLLDPLFLSSASADTFTRMRQESPSYWHKSEGTVPGFWSITRYADIYRFLRISNLSSGRGNMLETLLRGGDPAGELMVVVSEGRRHRVLRKAMGKGLSAQALEPLKTSLDTVVRQIFSQAKEMGDVVDFVNDVAAVIPLHAICELLAVPPADRPDVLAMSRAAVGSQSSGLASVASRVARNEILVYYAALTRDRRSAPGADLVSLLASCSLDGRPVSDTEIVLNCYNLLIGGDETTRFAIAGAVHAFATHPEQWRLVREREVGLDSAVEEVFRWTTPAAHVARSVTTSFDDLGATFATGDVVALWLASANRDQDAFLSPERFDVGREPNRHLSFGGAHHSCVGSYLARLELRTVLEACRENVANWELQGTPQRLRSNFLQGFTSLPVRISR
jgi:cytochrome P450